MRWPFRRRPAEPAPAAVASPVEPPATPADAPIAIRPAGAGPARRAWQTLPPLTPVVSWPRITVAPPDVTMTRSLTHRPAPAGFETRPVGRVEGLAEVLPALEIEPSPSSPPAAVAPPRAVRAVPRSIDRPPLTAATPQFVGEAREAAEPYRAPAWLRALSSGPAVDPLFGVMLPGPAQPAHPAPPPRPTARPMPTGDGTPPRRPLRPRGRLGLGAPLRPDDAEPGDADPEPAGSSTSAALSGTPALPTFIVPAVDDIRPPTGGAAVGHPGTGSVPTGTSSRTGVPIRPATGPAADAVAPRRLVRPVFVEAAEPPEVASPTTAARPGAGAARTHPPLSDTRRPVEPSSTPPPAGLTRDVGVATGVGLDHVVVHRGPDVDRQAGGLDAAAFAGDDRVHLGSAAGSDSGPEARALIAHELVHIAQQRRSGGTVPDETSAEGVRLEAEAVAVEQAVRESRPLPSLIAPPSRSIAENRAVETRPTETRPVGLPAGAPSHPASAGPVPQGGLVRGRVQRRPLDLGHAPARSAPAPAAATATPAAATPSPAPAPAAEPPTLRERFSSLGEGLASDAGDMVLASWSLEQGHDKGGAKGTGGGSNGSTATGTNSGGGSRQEQFNRLAQPALDRLNEERAARGDHPLAQLPPDEEERIWRQVDQGGGGGTGGGGHGQEQSIRSWHDLGTAATSDFADVVGSSFGLDMAQLTAAQPAAAVTTNAATPAAAATGAGAAHPDQHKLIEADDIDLDELGHRLYDRIRSRLRLELLLDRERAGLLSDFR